MEFIDHITRSDLDHTLEEHSVTYNFKRSPNFMITKWIMK